MSAFVRVELPKCSICLEGFGREDLPMSHIGGEQHPAHRECLQDFIDAGNQIDPIYGIQPILCPVCRIELPRSLSPEPLRNPAPSVRAASDQLSRSASPSSPDVSFTELEEESSVGHYFDRLPLEVQIRKINEAFVQGLIDEASRLSYIEHLRSRR